MNLRPNKKSERKSEAGTKYGLTAAYSYAVVFLLAGIYLRTVANREPCHLL